MTDVDIHLLRELFLEAVELSVPERAAFCVERCAGDAELQTRLEQLLAADSGSQRTVGVADGGRPGFGDLESVGPYRVVGRIGEGGMGCVFRGEQHEPIRRDVAIKVVRGEWGSDDILARFDLEHRALSAMNHRSIARVFDAGTTERGAPYFVMELVDGPWLKPA